MPIVVVVVVCWHDVMVLFGRNKKHWRLNRVRMSRKSRSLLLKRYDVISKCMITMGASANIIFCGGICLAFSVGGDSHTACPTAPSIGRKETTGTT